MILLESISLKVVPVEDIPSGATTDNSMLYATSARSVPIEDIPSQGSDDDFNVSKSSSLAVAGYKSDSGWQPPANMNYVIVRKR